jgi:type II secretory pathway component PulJ
MSVSSLLAFVLAGVAARSKSVARRSEDRIAELEARVAALEDDIAAANAQARRDQDLIDIWRERALAFNAPPPPRQQQGGLLSVAQYQQAAAALQNQTLAQYNAQQAMNAQNFYAGVPQSLAQGQLGQAIGLLGSANLLIDAELWCNCVPSRAQVWAATEPE